MALDDLAGQIAEKAYDAVVEALERTPGNWDWVSFGDPVFANSPEGYEEPDVFKVACDVRDAVRKAVFAAHQTTA